jgi:hypothetical protein
MHSHNEIQESIRNQPYAWPGGYERHGITDDGALLCSRCIREEYRRLSEADPGDGWYLAAATCDAEFDHGTCSHCYRAVGTSAEDE